MPAAHICWTQCCTAPTRTPVCRFGCALLHNTRNLEQESLQSSGGKLRNILSSPLLEAWGSLWAQPELTRSALPTFALLQPCSSLAAAHTCSSCCSSGEHCSFAPAGKERQRGENLLKGQAGTGNCRGTCLSQQSYRMFFFLLLLWGLIKARWSNFTSTHAMVDRQIILKTVHMSFAWKRQSSCRNPMDCK